MAIKHFQFENLNMNIEIDTDTYPQGPTRHEMCK